MEKKRQRCLQATAQAGHGSSGLVRVKLPWGLPCTCHPGMGTSGSKVRSLWLFALGRGGLGPEVADQFWGNCKAQIMPHFVFMSHSSMFCDKDGDLAHEFLEETIVTKNRQKQAKLKRVN